MTSNTETQLFEFLRERIAQRTELAQTEIVRESTLADLGLQSIDAVLLCGEVEDRFQTEVDPADIFEHETVGDFISAIMRRLKN